MHKGKVTSPNPIGDEENPTCRWIMSNKPCEDRVKRQLRTTPIVPRWVAYLKNMIGRVTPKSCEAESVLEISKFTTISKSAIWDRDRAYLLFRNERRESS